MCSSPRPVKLRLVLTALAGFDGAIGEQTATTYERVMMFETDAFATDEGCESVCRTAQASAALPGMYAPVEVPGVGPCIDGGTVDNSPIKWARTAGVRRMIVVSTEPLRVSQPRDIRGLRLAGEIFEILIGERLYRDLRDAESANTALRALDSLVADGKLSAGQRDEVAGVLGWEPIEIIQVRPDEELPGSTFAGFRCKRLRRQYIETGRRAATKAFKPFDRQGAAPAPSATT